jgi:hypothetical protein
MDEIWNIHGNILIIWKILGVFTTHLSLTEHPTRNYFLERKKEMGPPPFGNNSLMRKISHWKLIKEVSTLLDEFLVTYFSLPMSYS